MNTLESVNPTVLDRCKAILDAQDEKGQSKYGGSLDVTRPDRRETLRHLQQELADALQYSVWEEEVEAERDALIERLTAENVTLRGDLTAGAKLAPQIGDKEREPILKPGGFDTLKSRAADACVHLSPALFSGKHAEARDVIHDCIAAIDTLYGINCKRVLAWIEAICGECGSQKDEDGQCASCLTAKIEIAQAEAREWRQSAEERALDAIEKIADIARKDTALEQAVDRFEGIYRYMTNEREAFPQFAAALEACRAALSPAPSEAVPEPAPAQEWEEFDGDERPIKPDDQFLRDGKWCAVGFGYSGQRAEHWHRYRRPRPAPPDQSQRAQATGNLAASAQATAGTVGSAPSAPLIAPVCPHCSGTGVLAGELCECTHAFSPRPLGKADGKPAPSAPLKCLKCGEPPCFCGCAIAEDTARLDWLESTAKDRDLSVFFTVEGAARVQHSEGYCVGPDLRTAIDAARANAGGQK